MSQTIDREITEMTDKQATRTALLDRIDEDERTLARAKDKEMIEYLEERIKELRQRLDTL